MQKKTYVLGGISTNTYLVWDKPGGSAFVVDPAVYDETLVSDIEDMGLTLEYIILTHGHGDHIGGVPKMREAFPNAKIAAGKDEADLLADGFMNFTFQITGHSFKVIPDILLADGDKLIVGAMTLSVIETPGHTAGSISVRVEDALFSGDMLFKGTIGRTDLPTGDLDTEIKSLHEKLFKLPDGIKVYPGHDAETTIGYERKHNEFA